MGKVSLFLIVLGLVFLVPAVALTIIPWVFPAFMQNTPIWLGILRVIIIGLLYFFALALIILGLIIVKRDSE